MSSLQLPSIKDFLDENIIVLDSRTSTDEEILQHVRNGTHVFLETKDSIHYLSHVLPSNKCIWKPCRTIHLNTPLSEVIPHLSEEEMLFVQGMNDDIEQDRVQALGCIPIHHLATKLYHQLRFMVSFIDTMINTIDSSVTVINDEGIVLVWTQGAENIFSVKKEEILGKNITQFFDMDMLEIMKTLQAGRSLYRHQHQPRSDLYVLINSNPIYLDGQIIGAVVSETDITSQVRLHQELFTISAKFHDLEKEVAKLSPSQNPFQAVKGSSHAIMKTIETAKKVSAVKTNILITGESGVGKELFAKAIHDIREERKAPFIPINCGAIPSTLFESELFGYERGAFSGADQKGKAGKIALANGGTLLLDEIGEMPLDMQVKLLRVLQEKKFYPIGGTKEISVDFRVISATNRDLLAMVKEGTFREDLYYRLNVVNLYIPPLRERKEDIIELTHYFLHEFSIRYHRPIHGISQEVMNQLLQHNWSGNIRELRNVIERLIVFATDGIIKAEDLPFYHGPSGVHSDLDLIADSHSGQDDIGLLSAELEKYEREIIINALKQENDNKQACAKRLGITRATLYNKMKKLNIPI
ncbi:sigma-54 interaction domain-containing protein [Caldalkalibacillus mannanilyticus]|uniref:sigma-54 interaction domain-containing protein n=1 Tax=Caldalkalibacillus mannanilyticus TaxID=1418 RepID=UPI0004692508|nr:sigma 54-interacting transcriptional regulator [Caldalkalibacillus mannanilyticus]